MCSDMYNFGVVQRKSNRENITPHRISVVLLIKEFCSLKLKSRSDQVLELDEGGFYCLEPCHKRDFCILVLKLIQCPDLELNELQELLQTDKFQLLPQHLKTFNTQLQQLYDNGVGSVLDLMQNVKQLMVEPSTVLPVVHKTSVIGLYLRRILVFFDKMSFSQVVLMYKAYQKYFERSNPKKSVVKCKDDSINSGQEVEMSLCDVSIPLPDCEEYSHEIETVTSVKNESDRTFWSRRQAELFIAQQASLIQSNEMAALSPPHLQDKIKDLLQANPEYAEAHYLTYLNCLRAKEFCGAVNSLFHCFDRNTLTAEKISNQEERNKGYRYAALNLAMLYAQFGYKKEANVALKEAVMLAQDVNDNICLQYVLAWLYKLSDENKEILMERSISKSSDLNLSYLTSLGIQSFAQYAGATGGKPALVFDLLMKSDVLNCQHSMIDLLTNSYAQKAALWCLYGKSDMVSLCSQLLLHLNTANPAQGIVAYNGEGTCQAICNVINVLVEQGEYHIASLIIGYARECFPHEPTSHSWIFSGEILNFTEAMHNGKWQEAEQAIAQLVAIDRWESQLRKAELYLARGNYPCAAACVYSVLDYCRLHAEDEFMCSSVHVRALILTAELQCCSATAASSPAGAISLLTTALALAQLHFLDYLSAIVGLHFANVQLQMGLASQALKLVNDSLLVILSHGGYFDQGRALLLYAKCRVASASSQNDENRKPAILEAVQILQKARNAFLKVEAYSRMKDVLYLLALLYNELGYVAERKKCALEFRQWDEQHPTKIATTLLTRL
ncbi:Anaphase-promoting complex subunit 5 [Gryllus bimaculatus]|nr:Anaphase-promoting complex subunit 5 [Gryllus bimaculatus]